EVNDLPDADFTGLDPEYCLDAATVTLTPNTAGGTFSGPGMTGNDFNPSDAGVGNHIISYDVVDANGCTNSSNQAVEVLPLPVADFTGLNADYCVDGATVTLVPNVSGGTFSGPGVSGNNFDPATANVGTHTITYEITDGNGCFNFSEQIVEVNDLPDADFTGLDPEYCVNAGAITMTPNTTGGTFSGNGVSGNDFDPGAAGVGTHIITYEVTDGNGCTNSSTQSVDVDTLTNADFSGLDSEYCANDAIVTLVPDETGGTFSGPGISGNDFDPSLANAGNNTIEYEVIGANGCVSIGSQNTFINALPDGSFTGLDSPYCEDDTVSQLTPAVAGGIFSGNGVIGNTFVPTQANIGNNVVNYSITDANGCTNGSSQIAVVNALPDSVFTGLDAEYCDNEAPVTLVPNESGGTFTGAGVASGDMFYPEIAPIGMSSVTYSITSGAGCSSSSTQEVEVLEAPNSVFIADDLILEAQEVGPNITYQWYDCKKETIITGATDQTYEVTQNGTYALITSNGDCTDTSNCIVIYFASLDENSKALVNIFPNPNNGEFNINLPVNAEVNIYNAVGQEVYNENHSEGTSVIDMKSFIETGMYLVKVIDENGNQSIHNVVIRH
ncbi:MAG: T9SS type A sorting domain-containing protein, partial [Brumimicrobium sp.]